MTRKTYILSTLAGVSCLMAGVFTASTATAKTQSATPHITETAAERIHMSEAQLYHKPGSPIRYSYSLPKTVEVGQRVTLDLRLSEPFKTGDLQVVCNVKGDISLHAGSGNDNFSMVGDDAHEMQVSFTVNSEGRHYIQVQASPTGSEYSQGFRNFSIPVQVGPVQARKPHPYLTQTPRGRMVIAMPAQEVIK